MLIKLALKRLVRRFGFDIVKTNFGVHVYLDIESILGKDDPCLMLDVGANEGQTAIELSSYFPKATIISFEPSSSVFQKLVEKTRSIPNVTPVNAAVGPEDTHQRLFIHESSVMSSLLRVDYSFGWGKMIGEEDVPVISLDSYSSAQGIRRIDLLKTDTQGFDLEVLKGAARLLEEHRIGLVLTEVNFKPLYENQASFEDIYLFLRTYGFELVGLYNRAYHSHRYILWCDALFRCPLYWGGREFLSP